VVTDLDPFDLQRFYGGHRDETTLAWPAAQGVVGT
jgi:hypothetical protein